MSVCAKYFSAEIAEVIRTAVQPRILVLGGDLSEAEDALQSAHLHHLHLVAVEKAAAKITHPRLQIEHGNWFRLPGLSNRLGLFDFVYSPDWLETTNDSQSSVWLGAGVDMLRNDGRLLAALPKSIGSEERLAQLALRLDNERIRGHAIFHDEANSATFLEIHVA